MADIPLKKNSPPLLSFQNEAEKKGSKLSKLAKNTLKTSKNSISRIIYGTKSLQTVC